MLDYFDIRQTKYGPYIKFNQWNYVANGIHLNVGKMIDRFRRMPQWVASNHILGQYLVTMALPLESDPYDVYGYIKDECLYRAVDFGITTSFNDGVIHRGAFYGEDREILIGVSSTSNPLDLLRDWKNLEPVKVIRHGFKTIDYSAIFKKDKGVGYINTIVIDLALLCMQYYGFRYDESARLQAGIVDERDSISKFLYCYPLANMLRSHVDRAVLNNFMEIAGCGEMHERTVTDGQWLMDVTRQLRDSGEEAIKRIIHNNWDIDRALGTIPMVFNKNAKEYARFPDIAITRQDSWSLILGYLPLLKFGLKLGGEKYRDINSPALRSIQTKLIRLRSDNVWNKAVMKYVHRQVMDEIDEITDMIS